MILIILSSLSGKVVKLIRKSSVIPMSFEAFFHWFRILEWHTNDEMRQNDRDEIKNCHIFRQTSGMTGLMGMCFKWLKHHHSCHSTIFSSPVISTPQMTMGWMEWSPNDQYYYHELWLMEWHSNDGMTFKWWNIIRIRKGWRNDIRMMIYCWNE